ncbi:MAG: hypothetical protein ACREOU_11885 [Candidatus Eiseniibacteriota bacterium]
MTDGPTTTPPSTPRRRGQIASTLFIVALALVGVAAILLWFIPRFAPRKPLPSLQESRNHAQLQALHRYASRAGRGAFLPPNAISIGIREEFIQRALNASLPVEQTFEDGRYRVRLSQARVDFLNGASVVQLTGRGWLVSDTTLYADLLTQGTIGIGDLDFERARLEPRIVITDVRVTGSGPGIGGLVNPVASYFGKQRASDWNDLPSPRIAIPVRIAESITIPALEGDVDLPSQKLPLAVRVAALTTLERLMVASIEILPETDPGQVAGPPSGPWDAAPGSQRLRQFTVVSHGHERDSALIVTLRDSVRAMAARDSLWRALRDQEREIAVIVPEVVLQDLVNRMTRRYRMGAFVDLEPGLKEHVEEKIRVKALIAKVTAGTVRLDIDLHHLKGRISTAGEARLRLLPPDGLELFLPVRVDSAAATATLDVAWDPKAYASPICRGFETRQTLSGYSPPLTHTLKARTRFVLADGRAEGRPQLEREKVRVRFDLIDRSWAKVRQVFVEQDEFLKCGMAIDPDRMVGLVRKIGEKGVRIRLPGALPRFTIPVSFAESIADSAYQIDVEILRPELSVRPDHLRFGADAAFSVRLH